jgi:phosphoribosylformylglycinamidine synthase
MVGLIEKPAHITSQSFKDEGDTIVLLGAIIDPVDPLLGLGGSAYLQRIHHHKTGTPPRCDLEKEKELHTALRCLIYGGGIKSAHDCSEGGLGVALAECCISDQIARETPRLVGAEVDLSNFNTTRLDALLFGEAQGRVIISVAGIDTTKVLHRAQILGISALRVGVVGGEALKIKTARGELIWAVAELHDLWWNSIARAMR